LQQAPGPRAGQEQEQQRGAADGQGGRVRLRQCRHQFGEQRRRVIALQRDAEQVLELTQRDQQG